VELLAQGLAVADVRRPAVRPVDAELGLRAIALARHQGRVVAARSGAGGSAPATPPATVDATAPPPAPTAPSTVGGEGRITVAAPAEETEALLSAAVRRVEVQSRGSSREFELVSLLRRAGRRFAHLTAREGGPLDGRTVGEAAVREEYGVGVMALRTGGEWLVAPDADVRIDGGDELYVVGRRDELAAFEGAVGA